MNRGDDRGLKSTSPVRSIKGAQANNCLEAPSSVILNMSYRGSTRCMRDLRGIFGRYPASFLEENEVDARSRHERFASEMLKLRRAAVRTGKIDSGVNVFADVDSFSGAPPFLKGIPMVGTATLIRTLLRRGYYVFDVFAFRKVDGRCIIRCIIEHHESGVGRSDPLLAAEVSERAVAFFGGRARFCHIWDNRDNGSPLQRTFTVNLVREDEDLDGKQPKNKVSWCDDQPWRLMVSSS